VSEAHLKPYKCDQCTTRFKRKGDLDRHSNTVSLFYSIEQAAALTHFRYITDPASTGAIGAATNLSAETL
jgi:uncharacterized Zn-finger protein